VLALNYPLAADVGLFLIKMRMMASSKSEAVLIGLGLIILSPLAIPLTIACGLWLVASVALGKYHTEMWDNPPRGHF
jgi:hypothetical protein